MAKKDEEPKKGQTMGSGYTPFSKEDIKQGDNQNEKAEQLFLELLDIPKRAAKKKKKGKEVEDDDFYPTSMDETLRMEALLDQVDEAIEDRSDSEFVGYVDWMRNVLNWSKKRHWEFAWWIVICVLVVSIFFLVQANKEKDDMLKVKIWTEDQIKSSQSASIASYEKSVNYYQEKLAIDTLSKDVRKGYEESLKKVNKNLESVQKMSVKEFHKDKIRDAAKDVRSKRASAIWCLIWIGLYILALRPYGYMISKRRVEAKIYSGMRYALFTIAGALLGAAASMQVTTYITKWSDGSTTRDSDALGELAIQIIFILLAIALVLVIARIVIVVAAISGFIRNYDLIAIAKKLFARTEQAVKQVK